MKPETTGQYRLYLGLGHAQRQTIQKLRTFSALGPGWHYGEGESPSADTIRSVEQLLLFAHSYGLPETDVFPALDGGIVFNVYKGDHILGFMVEADGRITFTHEIDDEDVDLQDNIDLAEAIRLLAKHAPTLWKSSDLFTRTSTTSAGDDSSLGPSSQVKMVESPSLAQRVWVKETSPYAPIFERSTPWSPVNLPSSSESNPDVSRLVPA